MLRTAAWITVAALHIVVPYLRAESIPKTEGKTLNGVLLSLPKPGSVKPLLLVVGFSQKSSDSAKSWNKPFQAAYEEGTIDYYELADFQGIPSFVMTMILHGMRRSIPEPERSHFATSFNGEEEWKKLENYNDPKSAYVLLAEGSGRVISQIRGAADGAKVQNLQLLIAKLRSGQKVEPQLEQAKNQ